MLTWAIPLAALAVLGSFLAGQRFGSREPAAGAAAAVRPLGGAGAPEVTPDLSQLSQDERASRLYDRVMQFSESGRLDSARVYAPLAVQAYAALGAPGSHSRYDVGMIYAVVGDSLRARSEAENILNERPTHLLGLLLAMRTAATPELRAAYQRRFAAATKTELPDAMPEYGEHRHDIDAALLAAKGASR